LDTEKNTGTAKSRRRTQLRSIATRQKLLDSAIEAFSERGFKGTSTRDIAERAGVHHPLITYHFTNKDQLWRDATDHVFGEFNAALAKANAAVSGADPRARAVALLRTYVRHSRRQPALHRFILQESNAPSDRLDWLVDRHLRPLFEFGHKTLIDLQAIGVVPAGNAALLFNMIRVCAGGLIALKLEVRRTTDVDLDSDEQIDELADMLVHIFFPVGRARQPGPGAAATRN